MRNVISKPNWDPSLGNLQKMMDRVLNDFPWLRQIEQEFEKIEFRAPCDIRETDGAYDLVFDVPGVPKDAIHVELIDNRLQVSGERQTDGGADKRSFQRTLSLPSGVDREHIEARYKDGVLKIHVPKTKISERREIKIGDVIRPEAKQLLN